MNAHQTNPDPLHVPSALAQLDHLCHIVTHPDFWGVTTFTQGVTPVTGVTPKNRVSQKILLLNSLLGRWLRIVLSEGHIEPSQPRTGRLCGWPRRPMLKRSLWTDIYCWVRLQGVSNSEMPSEAEVYEVLDEVFMPSKGNYEFPSIELCRERAASLWGIL